MSQIAIKSYNEALGPHHPWALRKVAGVAMKAIKNRQKFIDGMVKEQTAVNGTEYTEEQMYKDFNKLGEQCGVLAKHLWAFCKENGFDKLP